MSEWKRMKIGSECDMYFIKELMKSGLWEIRRVFDDSYDYWEFRGKETEEQQKCCDNCKNYEKNTKQLIGVKGDDCKYTITIDDDNDGYMDIKLVNNRGAEQILFSVKKDGAKWFKCDIGFNDLILEEVI